MKTQKTLICDLKKGEKTLFSTPITSPDFVVGLMSTLAIPSNSDVRIEVYVGEVLISAPVNEEKDN